MRHKLLRLIISNFLIHSFINSWKRFWKFKDAFLRLPDCPVSYPALYFVAPLKGGIHSHDRSLRPILIFFASGGWTRYQNVSEWLNTSWRKDIGNRRSIFRAPSTAGLVQFVSRLAVTLKVPWLDAGSRKVLFIPFFYWFQAQLRLVLPFVS